MPKQIKDIKSFSTCELVDELKQRDGVQVQYAEPDSRVEINETGPVTVLVVTD